MDEGASATSAACRGSGDGWGSLGPEEAFPGGAEVAQAAKINNKTRNGGPLQVGDADKLAGHQLTYEWQGRMGPWKHLSG